MACFRWKEILSEPITHVLLAAIIIIHGDELPLGEQSSKENIKDDEICATQMGAEAEAPQERDFTV